MIRRLMRLALALLAITAGTAGSPQLALSEAGTAGTTACSQSRLAEATMSTTTSLMSGGDAPRGYDVSEGLSLARTRAAAGRLAAEAGGWRPLLTDETGSFDPSARRFTPDQNALIQLASNKGQVPGVALLRHRHLDAQAGPSRSSGGVSRWASS
jgi:hypothetical protein